jgi:hypothetical protein
MSELAAVALVTIAAVLMMGAFTRLPWLTLAALGPIIGLSAFVLIGTALVVIAGYMLPLVTVVATALILGALAISRRRRPDRRTWRPSPSPYWRSPPSARSRSPPHRPDSPPTHSSTSPWPT